MQSTVPSSITLDSSTAIKLIMGNQMFKERALMARNDLWHRIKIIRGARYDKELILRTILSAVEPADLIPARYQISGEDAYFIARNCGTALETLCRSHLIISIPNGDAIVLMVTLAFASIHDLKINIQPILLAALSRRYDPSLKYLKLDNFHRDHEVAKTVYCSLSQAKTLSHCLKLAKTALGPFERLSLRRNDLTSLAGMENSNLSSLTILDIRHNNLLTMNVLSSLKNFRITEIWLDGNPLCENYGSAKRYVESAKLYCPHLKKIDGIDLDTPDVPETRDNYYKNDSDSRKIVEQFLIHFFNIYDSGNRLSLSSLYRKNSLYSLTLGIPTNNHRRQNFNAFTAENRNILEHQDHKLLRKLLYRGPDEIVTAFERLPESFHDRKNFRWDIMYEDAVQQRIFVMVEGIFKTTINTIPSLYAFSRTFSLIGRDDNEYNILNDQYHVVPILPVTTTFNEIIERLTSESNDHKNTEDTNLCPRERERTIYKLMDLTTMNTEWCHRFLDNANWNAAKAIKNFMDNYKSSSIPLEAFSR